MQEIFGTCKAKSTMHRTFLEGQEAKRGVNAPPPPASPLKCNPDFDREGGTTVMSYAHMGVKP